MTLDASNPHAAAPQQQDVKRDARCIRCGYDLRGQDVGGRCPECGLKAHWSLRAPVLLSQYPATWVRSVARGVKLLAGAYAVVFFLLILAVAGKLEGYDLVPARVLAFAGKQRVLLRAADDEACDDVGDAHRGAGW